MKTIIFIPTLLIAALVSLIVHLSENVRNLRNEIGMLDARIRILTNDIRHLHDWHELNGELLSKVSHAIIGMKPYIIGDKEVKDEIVTKYCENDIETTKEVFENLHEGE